ncbi:hydantoinase B/oxoprolinase family protein [Virgibacillus oceani]
MMSEKIDAVTLEVMRNAFQSIAEEMGVTLVRTALSTNIKDRMDCSTAIYTGDGKLIAQAEHVPLHLGLMPSVITETLKIFPSEQLKEGDVILINDPYISGSHLPDIFLISPIFYEGRLVALAANIAHHIDVGGMAPGSMSVKATELYQEGLRLPAIRLCKEGVMDEEILRLIQKNVRTDKEVIGDLYAQLAANNVGEDRLKEMFSHYSMDYVIACIHEVMDYSDRRLRSAIKDVKNGEYKFEDFLEGDGITEEFIKIAVTVKVDNESMEVDFTGTNPQVKGPNNSTQGVTQACVFYAIKSLLDPEIPSNDGTYRSVCIHAPRGTVVNPNPPAPVSNANGNTAQRMADVMIGALAKVLPERAMAACTGSMNSFVIGGIDPQTEKSFSYVETMGGGQGATNGLDGMDGVHTNMTNTKNTPVEVIEQSYPLFIKSYALVDGSGGYGEYRGGMGIRREIEILSDNSVVTLSTERQKIAPWGLFAGGNGKTSQSLLITADGKKTPLSSKVTMNVEKGSTVILKTAGGGGYGEVEKRQQECIEEDITSRKIDQMEAAENYNYQ